MAVKSAGSSYIEDIEKETERKEHLIDEIIAKGQPFIDKEFSTSRFTRRTGTWW